MIVLLATEYCESFEAKEKNNPQGTNSSEGFFSQKMKKVEKFFRCDCCVTTIVYTVM
jgi:hypothetical protein